MQSPDSDSLRSPLTAWAGAIVLGLLALLAGSEAGAESLSCMRVAAGNVSCDAELPFQSVHGFRARFAESRLRQRKGKPDPNELQLVLSDDAGRPLVSWAMDRAAAEHELVRLTAFLHGQGAARFELVRPGRPWLRPLAALLGVAAAALAALGVRATYRAALREREHGLLQSAREAPRWRSQLGLSLQFLGGVFALAVVAQLAVSWHARRTQGRLEVQCTHRCRFQGMDCLPGGSFEMTLDPGTYRIELWSPGGADPWQPRTFTIAVGETRQVECK